MSEPKVDLLLKFISRSGTTYDPGIKWVSELIEIAGGTDIFPNYANQAAAKDRFVTSSDVITAPDDLMVRKEIRPEKIAARPGWGIQNGRIIEIKSPLMAPQH